MSSEIKTILIVDDDPDILVYLSTLFQDSGYATLSAKDGAEAQTKIRDENPDLVTLDITMPEKSGVKFYREMKEDPERKNTPVIIVTGVTHDFKKFISTRRQVPPPEGYVEKPIDRKKILELVKQHIG